MKLKKKIIEKIQEHNFSVYEDEQGYDFRKYSSAGQDFGFYIDKQDSLEEFGNAILNYYHGYDPSEEAYLWLDDSGHGKNGAPYEMIDVYNDMVECEGFIYELYEIILEAM